jgi:hypothetical protein
MGQFLTTQRGTRPLMRTVNQRRGAHGLHLADCQLGFGVAPSGPGLTRTASGIVFYDDFSRSDRALNGDNGWVDDVGTWEIVSGFATNTSGGNFDRNRQTGIAARTSGVYEARFQVPAGRYSMLRLLAADASNDWHWDLDANNGDKHLAYHALPGTSDFRVADFTSVVSMNSSFHVMKIRYTGTRNFVVWWDHNATTALGTLGTPFSASVGPTAPGYVGLMAYGGGSVLWDWVLVSSDHLLTVQGLTGSEGFRLFTPADVLVGSSSAQSGGSATLSLATLGDGLFSGYLQVYSDAGTWTVPAAGGRYPASGSASDLCGGDVYLKT